MVQGNNTFERDVNMQKIGEPITFSCPCCKETFEFDPVGEHELVMCPVCGTEFMTTKKGEKIQLEYFEFTPAASILCFDTKMR